MVEQGEKNSVEKLKDAAQDAVPVDKAPAFMQRYRTRLFQAMILVITCAFGTLTFLVKTVPSFAIDLQMTRAIQMFNFPFFTILMQIISWPGFAPQAWFIAAAIILILYGFGLRWEAVAAAAAASFTSIMNVLVKDLIQRPRPAADMVNVIGALNSYSFPSGHVMFYVGFFGFIAFLIFSVFKPSFRRRVLLAMLGSLIALIGISRIYLGQHWPSDVLGAELLGILALVANIQFYLWGKKRFFVRPAVSETLSEM